MSPTTTDPLTNRIVGSGEADPAELIANPRNWRTHPPEQEAALRLELERVGWVAPVTVNRTTGHLVDGHLRVKVAAERGERAIPVQWVELTPDEEARVLVALDPLGSMAGTDDALLSGLLADLELENAGLEAHLVTFLATDHHKVRAGADDVPAVPVELYVKPGDLWQLGRHRLLVGDSTDRAAVDRLLDGARVPLTFTSPPYGVGVDYGPNTTDTIANVRTLLGALAGILRDVTRPGGYAVLNFGDVVAASDQLGLDEVCEYPMAVEYWPPFRDAGWMLHTRRVWAKPHARVAAPWTASSNRAATDWEHLWTWRLPGAGLMERREPSYLGVWDTGSAPGDVVSKETFGAGMPVALAQWALAVYSNPGDLVMEPFTGTGTTLIAAEQLGRSCRAMELEPRFAQLTVERWQAFTGLEAVRVA